MTGQAEAGMTGGCQCGAVRYAVRGKPLRPHICHCRMCQKAFGNFFAPLFGARREDFALTRGALSVFRSSELTERGFCNRCGTPLTIADDDSPHIHVAIGSLDDPIAVAPQRQAGVEARLPHVEGLGALPGDITEEPDQADRWAKIQATNRQHPDHGTAVWPPVVTSESTRHE